MKNFLINFILILLVSPIYVFATDKGGKDKTIKESANYTINYDDAHGSFNLVYKTYSMKPVNVYIYNDQQKLIYADKITESGILSRPYNFKAMKPGNYTFKIVENQRVVAHDVVYAPIVNKEHKIDVSSLEDGKYKFLMIGKVDQLIKIRILDEKNTLVYSETINEQGSFSKIYNLKKLALNNCIFEVSVNNKIVYSKTF